MLKKRAILVCLVVVLIFMTAWPSFAQTKKLRNIGLYTFVKVRGQVPTPEVMKMLFERYSADIKTGFDLAGYPEVYQPFMNQLKTAEFTDTKLAVGEKLYWMMFRSKGEVKVTKDIEWAGKAPLDVFAIKVKTDSKIYHIVIPKPCGNIALYKIEEVVVIPEAICSLVVVPERVNVGDPVTVDMSGTRNAKSMTVDVFNARGDKITSKELTPQSPKWQVKFDSPGEYVFKGVAINPENKASTNPCQSKAYVNFPPICKLWTSCMPCEDYVGRPITFDASGSTDPDGEIVKVVFELLDANGNVINTCVTTRKPWNWEQVIKKAGTYTINVTVYDNDGAKSSPSDPCRLTFEVTQKKLFMTIDGDLGLIKGSYTFYPVVRGGIFYWINPNAWSWTLSGGGAIPTKGEPWKFVFLAETLINGHYNKAFLGAGLGYRTKAYNSILVDQMGEIPIYRLGKSGLDGVSRLGFEVFNNWKNMGHIIFELRLPLDRSFKYYHMFGVGFRFMF